MAIKKGVDDAYQLGRMHERHSIGPWIDKLQIVDGATFSRLDDLSCRVEELNCKFDALSSRFDDMDAGLSNIEEILSDIEELLKKD